MKKAFLLFSSFFILSGCGNVQGDNESESAPEETTTENTGVTNVIENDDFLIEITDVWLEDGQYNDGEIIVFEYDYTNKTDENIGVDTNWMFLISAVQDNDENTINSLRLTSPKDYGLEEYAEVKPGGTMAYGQAYELDDDFTPVTLTATEFAGDEFWSNEYDITNLEKR